MVRVDVAGRDRLDAQVLGEVAEQEVAARVASLVRALELDEEAVSEGGGKPCGPVRVDDAESLARAAGEADEAVGELRDELERDRRAAAAARGRAPAAKTRVPAWASVRSRQRFP